MQSQVVIPNHHLQEAPSSVKTEAVVHTPTVYIAHFSFYSEKMALNTSNIFPELEDLLHMSLQHFVVLM